jgi:hypothetical protein
MNSLILGKTTAGGVVPVQVDVNGVVQTSSSAGSSVDAAPDRVDTFTYLDAATVNERISTIVHSSASLGLSYTETFVYAGSAGAYRISTITRS